MIKLIAASYKEGVPIIGTHHNAYSEADRSTIQKSIKGKSFYYPADLGAYLFAHGIETSIKAHSGRTVVNGEYFK